jgi:hypothetical protein
MVFIRRAKAMFSLTFFFDIPLLFESGVTFPDGLNVSANTG